MVLHTSSAVVPGRPVHHPTLAARLEQFPPQMDTVVFLDGAFPDAPTIARTDEMLALFDHEDALCDWRPVTEAMKRVHSGYVVGAVDRETLVRPVTPYVMRRHMVEAMALVGTETWIDPMEEAASLGAVITLWQDPQPAPQPS